MSASVTRPPGGSGTAGAGAAVGGATTALLGGAVSGVTAATDVVGAAVRGWAARELEAGASCAEGTVAANNPPLDIGAAWSVVPQAASSTAPTAKQADTRIDRETLTRTQSSTGRTDRSRRAPVARPARRAGR